MSTGQKTFHIVDGDISDGHHTFGELYDHRCVLFAVLCLMTYRQRPDLCRRGPVTDGWFVLYLETLHGQVSYHLPGRYLELVAPIPEDPLYVFDGHTKEDVFRRLVDTARGLADGR